MVLGSEFTGQMHANRGVLHNVIYEDKNGYPVWSSYRIRRYVKPQPDITAWISSWVYTLSIPPYFSSEIYPPTFLPTCSEIVLGDTPTSLLGIVDMIIETSVLCL